MPTELKFSSSDQTPMMPRAGIDQDFLDKINQTVADIRNMKNSQPGVGTVIAVLTSPSGEEFRISVS